MNDNKTRIEAVYNTILNNYITDDSNEKNPTYIEFYNNKEEIIEAFGNEKKFKENQFNNGNIHKSVDLENLSFPILLFQRESSLGGYLFESDTSTKYILTEANAYFTNKNDNSNIWEFVNYRIYDETYQLHFKDKQEQTLGYIEYNPYSSSDYEHFLNDIYQLNKGADPIKDGWKDENGKQLSLDGWGEFSKKNEKNTLMKLGNTL